MKIPVESSSNFNWTLLEQFNRTLILLCKANVVPFRRRGDALGHSQLNSVGAVNFTLLNLLAGGILSPFQFIFISLSVPHLLTNQGTALTTAELL